MKRRNLFSALLGLPAMASLFVEVGAATACAAPVDATTQTVSAGPAATRPAAEQPTSAPAARQRWRLKPGSAPELQAIVDQQVELRKDAIDELSRELHWVQYTLNSVTRVARQDRDQRQWAKQFGDEYRARFQAIGIAIKALQREEVPGFHRLTYFLPRRPYEGPPEFDPAVGNAKRLAGRHVIGHYPFVGATVVSVMDANSAVVRPRCLDDVDFVGRDIDKFYIWVAKIREVQERDPVIATNLPSTEGWKPGDHVSLGTHWILRGRPLNPDGTFQSPSVTIEAFSPDAIEPLRPAATAPRRG